MPLPLGEIIFLVLAGTIPLVLLWLAVTGFIEKDPEVQADYEEMRSYDQDYDDF